MKTLFRYNSHLTFEEIQNYVSNRLDTEDRFNVENHLLDCPLCKDAVEGFQNSESLGEDKKALKKLSKEINLKKQGGKRRRMWPIRIAASVLLLLLPLSLMYYLQSNSIVDKYAMNVTEEFSLGNRTGTNDAFLEAISFCENKEFKNCIKALENNKKDTHENVGLNYFLGLAYFQNGDYRKATENLKDVIIKNSSYYDDAYWYLILAFIKNKEKSKAINLLEDYPKKNPNGFYLEEAEKLKLELY